MLAHQQKHEPKIQTVRRRPATQTATTLSVCFCSTFNFQNHNSINFFSLSDDESIQLEEIAIDSNAQPRFAFDSFFSFTSVCLIFQFVAVEMKRSSPRTMALYSMAVPLPLASLHNFSQQVLSLFVVSLLVNKISIVDSIYCRNVVLGVGVDCSQGGPVRGKGMETFSSDRRRFRECRRSTPGASFRRPILSYTLIFSSLSV
jgi:hypothetical protein